MNVVAKLKCEQCNRRVNWNILCPVGSNQVKVQCPYCGNIMYINKCEIHPNFVSIIFGGQNDDN